MPLRHITVALAPALLLLWALLGGCNSNDSADSSADPSASPSSGETGAPETTEKAGTAAPTAILRGTPSATPTPTPTRTPLPGAGGAPAATPTPTPTKVIGATEATATPTPVSPASAIKITGTWSVHSESKSSGSDGSFVTSVNDIQATFTAHSIEGSTTKLVGTAHVTFVKNYEQAGYICKVQFTGNSAWDAQLDGTYTRKADGSIEIGLLATPTDGPPYTDRSNCFTQQVRPTFPGAGGTLNNGSFDFRREDPASSGKTVTTEHMEVVP